MTTPDSTTNWLLHLPKAELHLHLEGTVSPQTLTLLSQRHDAEPITLDAAKSLYRYTNFSHFLKTFKLVCDRIQTVDDYALVVREMARDLASQGVRHAEVYVAFGNMARWRPELWARIEEVMDAIEEERIKAEVEFGITLLWIVDANRFWGAEEAGLVFGRAAELKVKYSSIAGVGIGGDEVGGPCEWFRDVYAVAKGAGLRLTAHAGESTGSERGPKEVMTALDMGCDRIGHAVMAQHDPQLIEMLKKTQTPLEINVTSNLCTGVVRAIAEHPLRLYLNAGLMVTLNSDDPAMFQSNLLEEYVLVQRELGLSMKDMKALASNSFRASFLGDEQKARFLDLVDNYQLPQR